VFHPLAQSVCVCSCIYIYSGSVGVTVVLVSDQFKQVHKQLCRRLQQTLTTLCQSLNTSPLSTFVSAGYQTSGNPVMDNTGFFFVTRQGSTVGQFVCDGRIRTARLNTLIVTTLKYKLLETPQHCMEIFFTLQNSC
jgi:hypothetical protein